MADTPPPPDDAPTGDAAPPDGPAGIAGSRSWRSARRNAAAVVDDPEAATTIIERASQRLRTTGASARLTEVMDDLEAALRMARLRVRGDYHGLRTERLVLLFAALLYLVNPMDVVPDVLPGVGFIDDGAILAWALARLREEVDRFRSWEAAGGDG